MQDVWVGFTFFVFSKSFILFYFLFLITRKKNLITYSLLHTPYTIIPFEIIFQLKL